MEPGEWVAALMMAGFFFLVIATFWVLKPLKRGVMIGYYADDPLDLFGWTFQAASAEQLGKVLNMIIAFAAVALMTYAIRWIRRHHLILALCIMFSAVFLVLAAVVDTPGAGVVWTLYAVGDLFNTLFVVLFWVFMADIVRPDQAKRIYGIVGLGGVLGGFVGATIVRQTVDEVGRAPLLAVLVIPMVLLGAIALAVNRHAERMGAPRAERLGASGDGHAVWEGARLVVQSRYFAGVAALILLYELVSNIVDFQLAASVQLAIDGTTERDAFFGLVGQISGVLSIVVQLLLTSWVMRRYGLGVALLFLPLAIGMGTVGYMAIGGLVYAAGMSVSDSALSYSIHQSAKEALYVAGRRQEKYKAKAFIDMFVQRAAKVLAVGLNLVVASYVGLANVQWLGLVTFGALAAWIPLVLYLGRQFENRPVREPAVAPMRRRVSLAPSGAPAG